MNKTDLIKNVAKATDLTQVKATEVVSAVLEDIVKSLKKGEAVTLNDFGTFKITQRKARKGFNPRTKQPIQIPAKKAVKFTPYKTLSNL